MKLLCTGDLHIGRRSSRLPQEVAGALISTAAAWTRLVDAALTEAVDVVLLSGDVVDRANRFFEATGALESGVRRLGEAGILTVAVAGNHDFDVLPPLAAGLDPAHFRLLGSGGRWERLTVERRGKRLHLDGWSFPHEIVREDPLAGYDLPDPDGVPVVGMVHGDVGVAATRYAPLSLGGLRTRPVDFWLLGHVHAPALLEGAGAPVLYPGSPQAMDPGEPGAHGAWLAELRPGRRFDLRRVPISTVRYGSVEVAADGVGEPGALAARVVDAVRAALRDAVVGDGALRHLSLRLRLTGRTPLHGAVEEAVRAAVADLRLQEGGAVAHVETIDLRTSPALDLEALAGGTDAPAVLAGLVLALRRGEPEPEHASLLEDARRRAEGVRTARPYLSLDRGRDGAEPLRGMVEDRALLLLDRLLAQKETA
jgi:DNA repair protein SbcD/Mre11